jgi:hypothetical protein
MAANGNPPLLHLMSFCTRNSELPARDKLVGLRQNQLTLYRYLREFESCYAFLQKWDQDRQMIDNSIIVITNITKHIKLGMLAAANRPTLAPHQLTKLHMLAG